MKVCRDITNFPFADELNVSMKTSSLLGQGIQYIVQHDLNHPCPCVHHTCKWYKQWCTCTWRGRGCSILIEINVKSRSNHRPSKCATFYSARTYSVGCINFIFLGNIKNRQPAYASLGSLEDQKIIFFFDPKTKFSWPPKVWYFWKFPQSLLVIFSSFLFLRKVQERTENTNKN